MLMAAVYPAYTLFFLCFPDAVVHILNFLSTIKSERERERGGGGGGEREGVIDSDSEKKRESSK